MKVIANVTLVVPGKDGKAVEVPPGASTDLPEADAKDLIARGFAVAASAPEPLPPPPDDILDGTIPEITAKLEGKSLEELQALREREGAGKTRKGVIAAIDEAIEAIEADDDGEEEEEADAEADSEADSAEKK